MRVIGNERAFDLNGPNCCELIDQSRFREIKARLGEDPLAEEACPETVWKRLSKSRAAIGTLMLNQSVIAGVGNVYRAEILFLLGIHPELPANQLERDQFDELWRLTCDLLKTGVKYNRIITVDREQVGKSLGRLKAAERLNIYKRKSCPKCGGQVKSWLLGNRKMYACCQCQTQ